MTKDEILLIADQFTDKFYIRSVTRDLMIGFARVIAAKEREACAAIVDAEIKDWDNITVNVALNSVAAEIRSRGE